MQLLLLLGHPGRLGNGIEPGHRVVDVAGQRDQHPRDLVAQLLGLPLGPRRHRHHGHHRPLGLLAAVGQQAAQPTRDAGQDHVVHRGLERPADQLHVVERDRQPGKALAVRDGAVERRAWRREEPGRRLLAASRQLAVVHAQIRHRLDPGLQGAEGRSRLPGQRRGGVAQHLRVGRQGGRVPFGGQLHQAGPRRQVQERRQHRGAADPVEDGVVHLGHQRRALPLEALDHVHLPERPIRIQLAAHDRRPRRRPARPVLRARAGWPGRGGRPGRSPGRRPTPGGADRTAPAAPVGAWGRSDAGAAE